ncbi:hypothetical protein BH09PLA1_BH09PLA1_00350 [soil metagenome]
MKSQIKSSLIRARVYLGVPTIALLMRAGAIRGGSVI